MPLCLGTSLGGVVLDQTEWGEPVLQGIRLCIVQDSVCYVFVLHMRYSEICLDCGAHLCSVWFI